MEIGHSTEAFIAPSCAFPSRWANATVPPVDNAATHHPVDRAMRASIIAQEMSPAAAATHRDLVGVPVKPGFAQTALDEAAVAPDQEPGRKQDKTRETLDEHVPNRMRGCLRAAMPDARPSWRERVLSWPVGMQVSRAASSARAPAMRFGCASRSWPPGCAVPTGPAPALAFQLVLLISLLAILIHQATCW